MILIRLCLLFILTACCVNSSMAAYTAAGDYGGFPHQGYTDSRINANTVIVRYDGNLITSPREVQIYLLYRSAKVTVENGYDYFVVVSTSSSPTNMGVKTCSNYRRQTNPPTMHRTYSKRIDFDSSYPSETRTGAFYQPYNQASCDSQARSAVSVIKMFKGAVPPVPNAYNAYDVITHLGPATWSPWTF
jgi:hypothetical protein